MNTEETFEDGVATRHAPLLSFLRDSPPSSSKPTDLSIVQCVCVLVCGFRETAPPHCEVKSWWGQVQLTQIGFFTGRARWGRERDISERLWRTKPRKLNKCKTSGSINWFFYSLWMGCKDERNSRWISTIVKFYLTGACMFLFFFHSKCYFVQTFCSFVNWFLIVYELYKISVFCLERDLSITPQLVHFFLHLLYQCCHKFMKMHKNYVNSVLSWLAAVVFNISMSQSVFSIICF